MLRHESTNSNEPAANTTLAELKKMMARFVPIPLAVDTSHLSTADQQALVKLIEAAQVMNEIYLEQVWKDNLATFSTLQLDTSEIGRARLHYFWLNPSSPPRWKSDCKPWKIL